MNRIDKNGSIPDRPNGCGDVFLSNIAVAETVSFSSRDML